MNLSFRELATANLARVNSWHPGGLQSWSISDWACAAAGEMGEACNAIKKLRRLEDHLASLNELSREFHERGDAIRAIGEEIADTVIYLDLLAQRLSIDLASEVREKFNKTSERYGFPERL